MAGISAYDLSSLVASPKGVSEAAETVELEDGLFGVNFVPKELGVHTVSVKYMDAHIPGSPFQFTVSIHREMINVIPLPFVKGNGLTFLSLTLQKNSPNFHKII